MCLDESDSAREEASWGKAVALALLDAAMSGNRKFALIHFSDTGEFKTDIFLPGTYTTDDVFAAAETFLGGGTDYETPFAESLRLISDEGFENADIVFATDGECALPESFIQEFLLKKEQRGFTVTGVLLDSDFEGFVFSLEPFCNEVYRTSEMLRETIVKSLLTQRA